MKKDKPKSTPGKGKSGGSGSKMAIDLLEENARTTAPVEQALAVEYEFRKAIEESIPVGIAGFDPDWKQIYVNPVFCRMVGWHERELIGRKFPQPYWPNDWQALSGRPPLDSFLKNSTEVKFRRKEAGGLWVLLFHEDLFDRRGKSMGRLISITDISARRRAEKMQKRLSAKLMDAQETERKQISQDLHDGIGSMLAGIKYSLENLLSRRQMKNDPFRTDLQEIISTVRSTIEETQRITKDLHPSILDDLGLAAALRNQCREFQKIYNEISIAVDFAVFENEVPKTIRILIYRVFQEAMNNIAKHSAARKVRVALKKKSGCVVLVIEDDGRGFPTDRPADAIGSSKGLGIDSMRERSELFGGDFSLQSRIGKGTRIEVSWPLHT